MGITVWIDTLEEMCDLMCDNKLPKQKRKKQRTLRLGTSLKSPSTHGRRDINRDRIRESL